MTWDIQSVDQNGNTPFSISIRDISPDFINERLMNNAFSFETVNGQRHVEFSMSPISMGIPSLTITLKGKRVIAANGDKLDSGTANWTNPSATIEAILIEGSNTLPWGWRLIVFGMMVVIVIAIYFFQSQKAPYNAKLNFPPLYAKNCNSPEQTRCFHCIGCGSQLPSTALFCPKCGRKP